MQYAERAATPTGEREVIRLAVGCALVSSKGTPGGWHRVEGYRCDCPGFGYRGQCAHVEALHDAESRAIVDTAVGSALARRRERMREQAIVRCHYSGCTAPAAPDSHLGHCEAHQVPVTYW